MQSGRRNSKICNKKQGKNNKIPTEKSLAHTLRNDHFHLHHSIDLFAIWMDWTDVCTTSCEPFLLYNQSRAALFLLNSVLCVCIGCLLRICCIF